MREIQGIEVFETLEEVVDPKHTALLVIDMQNGLASPDGYTARKNATSISHQRQILPALEKVLASARATDVCVVHIQVVFDKNHATTSPAWLYMSSRLRDLGPIGVIPWAPTGRPVKRFLQTARGRRRSYLS